MTKITKDDAASLLDKTPRAVERYAAAGRLSVTYEKGKTRDVPMFDRAEVEALAESLRQPSTPVRGVVATRGDNDDNGVSPGVAIQASPALQRAGSEQGIAMLVSVLADALRAAQTPEDGKYNAPPTVELKDKLTLSLIEASQLSVLSRGNLRQAIEAKKLKARIIGRGWRVKREELDAYVKKL